MCLLGLGGVMNKEDYEERLSSGVDAVEICTGAFLDPLVGLKIRNASSATADESIRGTMKKESSMGAASSGSRKGATRQSFLK